MMNNKTKVAMRIQQEREAWMSRRICEEGFEKMLHSKETSFGGPRIFFRGCVPIEHAIRMAELNRRTYD